MLIAGYRTVTTDGERRTVGGAGPNEISNLENLWQNSVATLSGEIAVDAKPVSVADPCARNFLGERTVEIRQQRAHKADAGVIGIGRDVIVANEVGFDLQRHCIAGRESGGRHVHEAMFGHGGPASLQFEYSIHARLRLATILSAGRGTVLKWENLEEDAVETAVKTIHGISPPCRRTLFRLSLRDSQRTGSPVKSPTVFFPEQLRTQRAENPFPG